MVTTKLISIFDFSYAKRWFSHDAAKYFSSSTQLSMKFKPLINTDIAKINGNFRYKSLKTVIYPADRCENANNCWHFNINEQDKFHAQLS